jgi:PAS domain S-box-containing protein
LTIAAGELDRKPGRLALAAVLGLSAVIVLCVSAAISYVSANRWVDHTLDVRQETEQWVIALLKAETDVRGAVVSREPLLLQPYGEAVLEERTKAAIVRDLVIDNPVQVQNVETADRDAKAAMGRLGEVVALVNAGRLDEARARAFFGEGQRLTNAFQRDAEKIRAEEGRLLGERRSQAKTRALITLGSGLLLTLSSAGLLGFAWHVQSDRADLLKRLGGDARRRLQALSDVATALAEVRTRAQVAAVVVEQGTRAVGADTCTLYMLEASGTALELIGHRGVAPEVIDRIRRITETSGNPETFATLKSGEAIWAENQGDYNVLFPALARVKAEGRRATAFWSMPLIVEGEAVGLLGMGFYDPRRFPPEERAFIETFSQQCAQALARAARSEGEDEARRWFQTTLRSIGDAVIATDGDGNVSFMNAIAERLTGWDVSEARGRRLDEVFCILSERTRKGVESPVAKVLREGVVVGLANHTLLRSKRGKETPIDDSAAPIRDESGRLFGVVLVFRDVTEEKRAQQRREFLARAGEALVASLDYRATLATVARLAVPELADWCAIEVLEPGATASQQVAVTHVDPSKVEFARALGERYPPDRNARRGVPEVIRTGEPQLYTEIPPELLEASARDAEHLRLLRELQLPPPGAAARVRDGGPAAHSRARLRRGHFRLRRIGPTLYGARPRLRRRLCPSCRDGHREFDGDDGSRTRSRAGAKVAQPCGGCKPRQRRIPRHGVSRAPDPLECHPRLDRHAPCSQAARRSGPPAGHHREECSRADHAHRGRPRPVSHH